MTSFSVYVHVCVQYKISLYFTLLDIVDSHLEVFADDNNIGLLQQWINSLKPIKETIFYYLQSICLVEEFGYAVTKSPVQRSSTKSCIAHAI